MNTLMVPQQRQNNLDRKDELPFGMTHPNDTPCPFASDDLPVGYVNTCCSFNTEAAAKNLVSLGHKALAELLHMSWAAEMLPDVAQELRDAADAFDRRYVQPMDSYDDPILGGISGAVKERFNPCMRPAFEAALASIRKAADWYEKVGGLGFGVDVWY